VRKIIAFFIRYPVWATVVMAAVIGFGLISLSQLRYSFFPETIPNIIIIQVAYPGASPDEVAEGVILKIEENLDGLSGVERTTSVSKENFGTVTVETVEGSDISKVLADVKNAVDRINSFPLGSEKPVIYEQKFRMLSLSVILFGETDLYNLKYIAEQFRDDLMATEEISQVNIEGLPNLEFSIEISEADLRRYQLTFDEIASAVRAANINISGGKFDTKEEEVLIRAWGRSYYADELSNIVIRSNPGGSAVLLKDIADIKEQWEDDPNKRYLNNRTAVVINIDQTEQEDILAIAKRTKQLIAEFNESHTAVEAVVFNDATIMLKQRLNLMVKNGLLGLFLVIASLGFFLNLRMSFWVAVSIPFSFAGMLIVASFSGITINAISLFGMIIVVGILVDDGIVVSENIYSHFERGKPILQAAIDGTMEVLAPVSASVLTTVIAFLPFFFIEGMVGNIIWHIALVVIASLMFSLLEAFLILPSHLVHSGAFKPEKIIPPIRKKIDNITRFLTFNIYSPILKTALKHKLIAVVIPVALVMLTVGLVGGGFIGLTFFPTIDGDTLPINLSLVSGRQEAATDSVLKRIEKVSWQINDEIKNEREDGLSVITAIKRDLGKNDFGETGSHAGRLVLQLLEGETRQMESQLIANRIRSKLGDISEVRNITFGRAGHFGKPVSIGLLGSDFNQLDKARDLLVDELKNFTSLKDVTDSDQKGRREINITLKPRAYALGLTLRDIAGQVRQGFYGQEIQRIQRNRDEIKVWVRYKPEDRAAIGMLDRMRIRVPGGSEYPFSELAQYNIERGVTAINHLDRNREIKIEANLADNNLDLPPIIAEIENDVLPRVIGQVHGVKASFEGQSRDQAKTMRSARIVLPMAFLGMFILVVLVFRSYAQALIILSLIPIGILGALWGHGIQGLQVNMLSMFGIIALSGIIINDSIVFVDQINRNLREGQKVDNAVYNAGISRFRPIILTTLTTALGLAPLIFETSRQAQFLIPMAVSVAYGLIFGTFILLVILPSSYMVLNSLRVKWSVLANGSPLTSEAVEPAVKELKLNPFK